MEHDGAPAVRTRYLFLDEAGVDPHDEGCWPLPVDGAPGAWRRWDGATALHALGNLLRDPSMLVFFVGHVLYEVETANEVVGEHGRPVALDARLRRRVDEWNPQTARLFAADCAERVAPLFGYVVPGDERPRNAIRAARAFARGQATAAEMALAAEAARAAVAEVTDDSAAPPHTAARLAASVALAASEPGDLRPATFAITQMARTALKSAPLSMRALVQSGDRASGTSSEAVWQNDRLLGYISQSGDPERSRGR